MLRPEMKLFEHSEFSSQALLLIRFQTLYFSQIPEWNKDPASRISVPFYPGNSEYFPVYLADLLSGMTRDKNLYGAAEKEHRLELKVLMLNINIGHNPELMKASRTLWEYAEYTGRVRKYAKEFPVADAVEQAITECIQEGILKNFLEKNRTEAKNVSIYEYDQEKHLRQEREDAWEDGRKDGLAEGERIGRDENRKELIQKKLQKGKTISEIADALEESEAEIQRLIEEMNK